VTPILPVTGLHQVGIVVRDLRKAMRAYNELLGMGPWHVYTYQPPLVKEMTYMGRRHDYAMRIALTMAGNHIVELVETVKGPNIYQDFLDQHGEGIHHVMSIVEDFDASVARLEAAGYPMIQSGRGFGADGTGAYAYFDTTKDLGLIYELVEIPKVRVPPEEVYPA
jgi:catechol 2,3-dioxygenase-like lactoylglutathione lyase family enzyme